MRKPGVVIRRVQSFREGQKLCIAALGRDIHRNGAFHRKTLKIVRTARFWAGAGKAFSAKRLNADHGACHGTVHIGVANLDRVTNLLREALQA